MSTLYQLTITLLLFSNITICMNEQPTQSITFKQVYAETIHKNNNGIHPKLYAAWNPQQALLALATEKKMVFCNGITGEEKKIIHQDVTAAPICFSPNGSRMIVQSRETDNIHHDILLYHGFSGDLIKKLRAQQSKFDNIYAFSPDSLQIIHSVPLQKNAHKKSLFIIYDAINGETIQRIAWPHRITQLAFKNNIEIIDNFFLCNLLEEVKPIKQLAYNGDQIECLVFSHNGLHIAAKLSTTNNLLNKKDYKEKIVLYDDKHQQSYEQKSNNVITALSFSPDSKHLLLTRHGEQPQVWDTMNGNIIQTIKASHNNHHRIINQFIFVPHHPFLIMVCYKEIVICDSINYEQVTTLKNAQFLAISSDGNYMAAEVCDEDKQKFVLYQLNFS